MTIEIMNSPSKIYRNQQIEALRGIAILIIVFFHVFDRYLSRYIWTVAFGG